MQARGYGRIVFVSSVTGPLVTAPGAGGYGAAEAGVDGLMRAIALEGGPHGVTANSVAPGWIATANTPVGRPGHSRRGRRGGRVPGRRGRVLRDRQRDRRRRRQHHQRGPLGTA
jgi:NAD(P)-dependent dehydrogenase (short-subunit alcohol dehydrogenase family)